MSSLGISSRTGEKTPLRRSKAWKSFLAGRSNIAASSSRKWIPKPSSGGPRRFASSMNFRTRMFPGQRAKRWEDAMVLLDAGIDVLTTMNLQHLESLNDQIWQISGIRVRETVPDWVVKQADEVVMVDVTPEALINRLRRGVVYAPDKAERALENFFKEQTLTALREMALRQAAHEVDVRLKDERPTASSSI